MTWLIFRKSLSCVCVSSSAVSMPRVYWKFNLLPSWLCLASSLRNNFYILITITTSVPQKLNQFREISSRYVLRGSKVHGMVVEALPFSKMKLLVSYLFYIWWRIIIAEKHDTICNSTIKVLHSVMKQLVIAFDALSCLYPLPQGELSY